VGYWDVPFSEMWYCVQNVGLFVLFKISTEGILWHYMVRWLTNCKGRGRKRLLYYSGVYLVKYRKIRKPVVGWPRIELWTSSTLEAGLLISPLQGSVTPAFSSKMAWKLWCKLCFIYFKKRRGDLSVTSAVNEIKRYLRVQYFCWHGLFMILATFVRRRSGLAWFNLSIYSVKCSWKKMEVGLTGVLCYGRKGGG
jgi:hypothetical protein